MHAKRLPRNMTFYQTYMILLNFMHHALTQKEGFVLDPFSGSRTVLLEAPQLDLKTTNTEINPAAYARRKFFAFCNLPYADRHDNGTFRCQI